MLADPRRQINFIKKDPKLGRFTVKSIMTGIIVYIRVGFGKFVMGEPFDSVTFREGGASPGTQTQDTSPCVLYELVS